MKTRRLFSLLAAMALGAVPMLVRAQFQPPNPDELKMTSDPKAPGADAVILEMREVDNENLHSQVHYLRIKVLTERGKDAGIVEMYYYPRVNSIVSINGRTVHPDGTVIPLAVKPEDLLVEKTSEFREQRKVLALPSVEVGSVLEFSYVVRYDRFLMQPHWRVQQPFFVHSAHFEFLPFGLFQQGGSGDVFYPINDRGDMLNSLVMWPDLPQGNLVKQDAAGRYILDISDVPAAPREDWMPPVDSFLYKVRFYYQQPGSAQDFWIRESKFWSKDVDKFVAPSDTLRGVVNGIVAPGDSDVDKAKKLYAAVQALDNTDFSRAKTQSEREALHLKDIKHAEDTWKQKSGSSGEIAYLYLAMLRAAGLTAYAMEIVDRRDGILDQSYMYFDQLNVALVILSTGGKEMVLDPGEKMCPFGQLAWYHSEARGVRQSAEGISLMSTPAANFADNMTTYNANITLDPKGGMTGSFTIVMNGQDALHWRQLALESDTDAVKKQYEKDLAARVPEGVDVHVDQMLGLDNADGSLIAMVKAEGAAGTSMSKRLLLPGYFFETRGSVPFVNDEHRQEPVDMQFASRINENVTYHLPDGYTVEGAPKDARVAWPSHAILVTKSSQDPGQIAIAYSLVRGFALAQAGDYQDLRGFYQQVATTNQEQLVLSSAATGKGN
jgi:Domain of Unknown Function with PDB structure (DUF3857)/Transglutaminase-like superfamily